MDESFELRVKRLFGSHLFDTVPNSSFPTSSWSVASGEVERREWNRERGADLEREDIPCASAFDEGGCFSKKYRGGRGRKENFEADLDDLDADDDDDEEEEEEEVGKGEDVEEREIRSSVGLDPTLDNEDEEDEYDKAAFFKENMDERVYMRDVKDHGPHLSYYSIISDPFDESFEEINPYQRDPRADHFAARNRINEDKEATITDPHVNTDKPAMDLQGKITEVDAGLKPILKRKEVVANPRPKKRVRFDPGCENNHDKVSHEVQDFHMVPQSMETTAVSDEDSTLHQETTPAVPDYIKNPSKYTRYTFDSSDDFDDRANRSAFEDFRNLVKQSKPENLEPEFTLDLPHSITFTPQKKKAGDPMSVDDSQKIVVIGKEPGQNSIHTMGIAAGEAQENDACEMEEDDIIERNVNARKADRKYRSKAATSDPA
ncbi:hypothetical protein IHE45_05G176000 [Dioscorea alata]|uniref:Uncharacterized protein n=1 Tax=Dioscorea alata TaxID=55571 RepID=A0ACB7W768_DIOAL|nr:hypothetical protein IHE45_05G176000 [Dioscorea alata]